MARVKSFSGIALSRYCPASEGFLTTAECPRQSLGCAEALAAGNPSYSDAHQQDLFYSQEMHWVGPLAEYVDTGRDKPSQGTLLNATAFAEDLVGCAGGPGGLGGAVTRTTSPLTA